MVKDLLDWDSQVPHFLQDVLAGKAALLSQFPAPPDGPLPAGIESPHHLRYSLLDQAVSVRVADGAGGSGKTAVQVIGDFAPENIANHYVRGWLEAQCAQAVPPLQERGVRLERAG